MDETEKYKQRLEAIAEKRRLQEDQDRARRDMEDEKLRLQQLKRKSLRDQWLMEAAPLSTTSPDAQSPRSPLWGSQAQEMEKHIDKLQAESQRLAEEEEMLKEQMGDGQMEAGNKAEAEAEMVQDAVVQNGENNGSDEGKTKSTPLDETAAVLTNGDADTDLDTRASTNGPVEASGGVGGMELQPGLGLGVSEAEPAQVPNVNFNEEEEGTLVMRAERVIITDEGDDVPEELTPQQETTQTEEAGQEGGEAAEGRAKTEAAPETFTQPEQSEATEPTVEEQSTTGNVDSQSGVKTSESREGERKSEERDEDSEGPTSVQVQPHASAPEGTAVDSVPVYSEVQASALAPELVAEGEAATSPEGAEAALKAQGPAAAAPPGQFQEVPLADPQEGSQRTEARPGEREPLLSQAKANDTQAGPATAAAASTETHSSARAGQGAEAEAPKHKTCQCCSVM